MVSVIFTLVLGTIELAEMVEIIGTLYEIEGVARVRVHCGNY